MSVGSLSHPMKTTDVLLVFSLSCMLACGQSTSSGPGASGQAGNSGSMGSSGTGLGSDAASPAQSGANGGSSGQAPDASNDVQTSGAVDDGGQVSDASTAPAEAAGQGEAGASCSQAGTLCWGFEEGAIPPGWMRYRTGDGFPGQLLVDQTMPHRGNYSLHAKDYHGGSPTVQGGPKYTITYSLPANFGPVLWGRAFVYTSPAAPQSHAGFFNARYPRPNSTATAMSLLDWYEVATFPPPGTTSPSYMAIYHPPEPTGTPEDVRVSDASVVLNNWACLEWLFDASGGSDAQAAEPRMWLDGTELSWPTTFIYPTGAQAPAREKATNFIELETGIYMYQGLTAVTNWWIDDLAVGPQRIGCN
jgi:hypothetical protein